jgi:hypothetical protein
LEQGGVRLLRSQAPLRYTRRARDASEIDRRASLKRQGGINLFIMELEHAIHPLANYDINENDMAAPWITPRLCGPGQL